MKLLTEILLLVAVAIAIAACQQEEYMTDPGKVLCDPETKYAYQLRSDRSNFVVRRANLDKLCNLEQE